MTIKQKLLTLVVSNAAIIICLAFYAIYSSGAIKKNLHSVAYEDIPLTKAISQITVHQLEQAIIFERAFGFSMRKDKDAQMLDKIKSEQKNFGALAKQVDQEILEAQTLVEEIIQGEHNAQSNTKFEHVLSLLNEIEHQHNVFDHHVEQAFTHIENNNPSAAEALFHTIEEEEKNLDHALENLLNEISVFTADAANHTEEIQKKMITVILALSVIGVLICSIVSYSVSCSILRPLLVVQKLMGRLADGDLEREIRDHPIKDELFSMVRALQDFRIKLIDQRHLEQKRQETQQKQIERAQKLEALTAGFEQDVQTMLYDLSTATTQLNSAAQSMSSIAEQTSSQSQIMAQASDVVEERIKDVYRSTEEINLSTQDTSERILRSTNIATDAVEKAKSTNGTIKRLSSASAEIGDVINMINDIAEQTNLLALNATIEAARAGEAGKGFAVVASEVKGLAAQTAQATEQISGQVVDMQSITNDAVTAIGDISGTIELISDNSENIAASMEQQNMATSQISVNMKDSSAAVTELKKNVSDVSETAYATGSAATEVLSASESLNQQAETLQSSVNSFLSSVKAI